MILSNYITPWFTPKGMNVSTLNGYPHTHFLRGQFTLAYVENQSRFLVSIDRWKDKEKAVYIHNGVLVIKIIKFYHFHKNGWSRDQYFKQKSPT